jgi:hypothetical protein
MRKISTWMFAALALVLVSSATSSAQVFVPAPPPVVTYSPPVVVRYAPAPVYVAPPAPVVQYSYYPATTSYVAPAAYSVPVYTQPTVSYSVPVVGSYTTRSYYGFGIFRPRGYYTETYYSPYIR